jgi:hypothetical protein
MFEMCAGVVRSDAYLHQWPPQLSLKNQLEGFFWYSR